MGINFDNRWLGFKTKCSFNLFKFDIDDGVKKSANDFKRMDSTLEYDDYDYGDDEIVSKKFFKPRPLANTGFANLGQWEKHTRVKFKNNVKLTVVFK